VRHPNLLTGQNRSTAVMQRRVEAPDSLDYFPTPPWATRALIVWLIAQGVGVDQLDAWEPACGEGHMTRPLLEYFARVRASDVYPYGQHEIIDFLLTGGTEPDVDWIISNPPFNLAVEFIQRALAKARGGVAMLLRGSFLEGQDRYAELYARMPPSHVLVFTERVVMLKGRLIRAGAIDPFAHKPGTKASSATSYFWFVWLKPVTTMFPPVHWVPPLRLLLERPGDYPVYDLSSPIETGVLL